MAAERVTEETRASPQSRRDMGMSTGWRDMATPTAPATEAMKGSPKTAAEPERPRTKVDPEGAKSPTEPEGWSDEAKPKEVVPGRGRVDEGPRWNRGDEEVWRSWWAEGPRRR